ncbi:exodeoxyribonuclease V subunit beta [Thermodesulfobacteriota bacterium]
MKRLDLVNTPLTGTNLIEANAGTGKTYAISGLFVRLILEKGFPADQILVVTFTRAATEELKERIRHKLVQAKNAFSGDVHEDVFLKKIVKKQKDHTLALQLLQDALTDFDRAAIFTIHGFCQRILHENAFETGSLFDTELIADQMLLQQAVADDFWRKHFSQLPTEFVRYARKKIPGPSFFFNLLTKIKTPEIRIVPKVTRPSFENLDPFRETFEQLKNIWPSSRETVKQLLCDPSLSGSIYGGIKPDKGHPGFTRRMLKVSSLMESMDRLSDVKSTGFPLFKGFEHFTSTKLSQSVKKKQPPPVHEVFNCCDRLYRLSTVLETEMERFILYLKSEFVTYAKQELYSRKKDRNLQFFDDLLVTVQKALSHERGNALSREIRKKYKAALVDEFQDTDPVQYDIFSKLFGTDETVLFMIGDPKQAIYSFRGADIFSYMAAARQVENKYTLSENWRSGMGLISAVNTLFSNVEYPFVFDEILFEESRPGQAIEPVDDASGAPLNIWFIGSKAGKPIPKSEAVPLIADAVAEEILYLVSHGLEGITVGDIAVLVRTNRQAQIIKDRLSRKRIPSVLYNAIDIFTSREALEMQRVLLAISEPGSDRQLKSALATDLLGLSGEKIHSIERDYPWWESRLSDFREYNRIWRRNGFIRMFRMFMAKENIKHRLLSFPDGERRLTNLLHLSEILHQASIENNLGVSGLLKWLSERRNSAMPEQEEHQLRLESDETAVKIITIHKSKGLEYPVVFCPYGWDGSLIKGEEITFHDTDAERRLTLDLGSTQPSRHRALAQNELLAENLRLLYVAVTRAKARCYLVWGRMGTADTSAMAHLLYGGTRHRASGEGLDHEKNNLAPFLGEVLSNLSDDDVLDDLKRLADKSQGTLAVVSLSTHGHPAVFHKKKRREDPFHRTFSGKIDKTWKVSSYSALVSRRPLDIEQPDRDAFPEVYPQSMPHDFDLSDIDSDEPDIFSFPKGTRAGIFFHDIFEHIDFKIKNPNVQKVFVTEKLKSHGFDPIWKSAVCKMIKNVISTPLLTEKQDLLLSSIGSNDRVNEMEFYFPLKPVTPQRLKRVFEAYNGHDIPSDYPHQLGKLVFSPSEGFMKGYIDMIFHSGGRYYLVDWKSNFLGMRPENYGKKSLKKTMSDSYYFLQYCLYTLALHLYLRLRVPDYHYETDFGGVFYIFIRGVDQKQGADAGIFADFLAPDFIHELERNLVAEL